MGSKVPGDRATECRCMSAVCLAPPDGRTVLKVDETMSSRLCDCVGEEKTFIQGTQSRVGVFGHQ